MARTGSSRVLAAAACGFTDKLVDRGGDPDMVLGNAGLNPEDLSDPTHPISLPTYCRMLELASDSSKDINFGLNYGKTFAPEMMGLIGFIPLCSPTARSALENFIELFPLHQNFTETNIIINDEFIRMEYRILDSHIIRRRHDAEFTIGVFSNIARRCLGKNFDIVRVDFEHASPETLSEHHQFFDSDILFSQRTNAITLRATGMNAPLEGKNLSLLNVLRGSLKSVACPVADYDLIARARTEIRGRLASQVVKLPLIAEALHIPTWSLQRRLADENITFTDLVNQVRRELAEDLIQQRHIQLSEIAFLLGYSELSAFSRAFRGWCGQSPQQYRQSVLARH